MLDVDMLDMPKINLNDEKCLNWQTLSKSILTPFMPKNDYLKK